MGKKIRRNDIYRLIRIRKNKKIKIQIFLPKNFRKIKIDVYQILLVLQFRVPRTPTLYFAKK